MSIPLLSEIDKLAAAGKATMSGHDVVAVVQDAIRSDKSVSFYLTRAQAKAIKEWYWTSERIKLTGLKLISEQESERIKSELGVTVTNFRYSAMKCKCGHLYGAFDFLQQGVREHGLQAVNAVFSLKHSTFLQVNPTFVPICPVCGQRFDRTKLKEQKAELRADLGDGEYDCEEYGGCCCCSD